MSAAMQIAERVYSLALEQDDPTLMIGADSCLSCTFYNLGDFESARQYARHGVQITSEMIELSTRHNLVYFLTVGAIHRGWARSASGDTVKGISSIEQGMRDFRASGTVTGLPFWLAVKAEALHLADRTSEALAVVNEAEALAERFEQRVYCAELHRLRGVFLATLGAEETQIEASFCAAISTAKEQKSVSLEKRAEATYAEYRRQKASGSGGRGFRLPLC
jgi:predicted ATPase